MYSLDVDQFFSIVFALCSDLLWLSSSGKLLQACVSYEPPASLEWLCDLGVVRIFFQSSFVERFYDFGFVFLHLTRLLSASATLLP